MHKKRKRVLWVLALGVVLTTTLAFAEWYVYERDLAYRCTNAVTRLPVLIKVVRSGAFENNAYVDVVYHHTDGQAYVIGGMDNNFSIFDDSIFVKHTRSVYGTGDLITEYITLDRATGSFSVSSETKGERIPQETFSGTCDI